MNREVTSSRARASSDRRWLALALAVLITLGGGALYGSYSQRWGAPADLIAAAAHLENLPHQLGPWKLAEELEIESSALEMLDCAGYINRRYINQQSGQSIAVCIIVGPPGPTAVHTPEICFSSRAYEIQGERKKISLAVSPSEQHTFWNVDFSSRNALADGLRVYYAWGQDRLWRASSSPRFEFAAAPMLYKIQLATPIAPALGDDSPDPGRQFLDELNKSGWTLGAG